MKSQPGRRKEAARPKPIPFPHLDAFASLKEARQEESFAAFVTAFAKRVQGLTKEVIWSATETGAVIETVGDREGVEPRLPSSDLVVAEIHNHPNPRDQRQAFLHLSDIGASFASGERVFGLYTVLIAAPQLPYIVACKFNAASIASFRSADPKPHEALFTKIKAIHGSAAGGEAFLTELRACHSIQELLALYERTVPMLDFCVMRLDAKLSIIAESAPGH